ARQPLLVAIDDAQWMDEFSGLAFRVLVPALASSPVLWLFARRVEPSPSVGQEIIDRLLGDGAREIDLQPLDDNAVARFCAQVVGAEVDATVLALAGRCSGNPFLLEQLLMAMRDASQLMVTDGVATVVGDELPSTFLAIVDQRLRRMSADAQGVLRAGS